MAFNSRQSRCKAFGSEERVLLIECLKTPKNVTELLTRCSLSQSALSQHLRVLRNANVVTVRKEGRNVVYSVPNKKLLAAAKLLLEADDGKGTK